MCRARKIAVQARANQTDALIAILPPPMRSQHVIALAFTKQCPWAIGAVPLRLFGDIDGSRLSSRTDSNAHRRHVRLVKNYAH
jgi:hypothetical protein